MADAKAAEPAAEPAKDAPAAADGAAAADGGDAAAADPNAEVVEEPVEVPKPDPITPEVLACHLKIAAAFRVFDHENNNTIDAREFGTVIRSLGCCPSEAEIKEMLIECEDEDASTFVKYERFEPMMTKILVNKKYKSASEDTIMRAFQVLDSQGSEALAGFLTEDQMQKFLTNEGEPFTTDEFDEMMTAAKDLDKGVVYYDEHVPQMALEEPS